MIFLKAALARFIPALTKALKPGGTLVFREPLNESNKLNIIRRLMDQNILTLLDSRVTDVPLMGNALESVYVKQ
jgi:protein-L-isoaspartate O-methyltransferase